MPDVDDKSSSKDPSRTNTINVDESTQWVLSWHDLSYSVPKAKQPIISSMNGSISAGSIVGILGGSGAGKTTLLNSLSGRLNNGTLGGKVLLNGKPREKSTWKKICAQVEQDDIMFTNLTVYETLMYSASLRLPSSIPRKQKEARVNEVMAQLGLLKCRNTRIGDRSNKGISGGERKRVSIGVELVSDPRILFLDEPTSGLDSFNAYNVIEMLKDLAKSQGKIILMTIHQPRTSIMKMLDKIILLSNGKPVFSGSLDDSITHFERLGFPLPDQTNPSDYYLDLITPDQRSEEALAASLKQIGKFHEEWESQTVPQPAVIEHASSVSTKWPSTWIGELLTLLHRNLKDVARDKATIGATIGQGVIVTLLIGFLFWQITNDAQGVQNRIGVAFFIAVNQSFGIIMPTINVFPLQRQLIKRERVAGSYRASSAYIAKFLSTLPLTIAGSLLLSVPVYWMIGFQNNAEKFFTFVLIVLVHSMAMNGLGIAIGSAVPNVNVGAIFGPLIIVVFLLFGGQLVNLDTLPVVLRWIQWLSPIAYTNKAISQNEFDGLVFDPCGEGEVCYRDGEQVLSVFNLDDIDMWHCVLINTSLMVGFLLIGFFAFRVTSKGNLKLK